MDIKKFVYDYAMSYAQQCADIEDTLDFVEKFQSAYFKMAQEANNGNLVSLNELEKQSLI